MRWTNFFHIYQPPAWDEAIVRRAANEAYLPLINILQRRPKLRVTLNITGALIEQLTELGLNNVLVGFRQLAEAGQVELVGSAMYHPILPLLPTEEIVRQIDLQESLCRSVFGRAFHPRGFYAPEMAYGPVLDRLLLDRGYEWIIVDEIASGSIGQLRFDRQYTAASGLGLVFRNRHMSDYLSFGANIDQPEQAIATIQHDDRSRAELVTAMDGENLGHHRPGVDRLWELLATWPDVTSATVSEYRHDLPKVITLDPHPSSWSSLDYELRADIPYGLWNHPDNPIHKLQWQLTYLVIEAVGGANTDPGYDAARRLLDRALTSDKYWWASASPWWDMTIVIRETQRLIDVIAPLTHLSARIRNQSERLMQQVAATVELWDKTGLAKRRQATYLRQTGDVKYMGGQKISE
ncbi:MAG: hypothetical protein HY975_03025 [Candidatus Kerfeldbacteria bacterium]|nr:hypothetical protein [Candidatus Kerfeldbacteria bacterium]